MSKNIYNKKKYLLIVIPILICIIIILHKILILPPKQLKSKEDLITKTCEQNEKWLFSSILSPDYPVASGVIDEFKYTEEDIRLLDTNIIISNEFLSQVFYRNLNNVSLCLNLDHSYIAKMDKNGNTALMIAIYNNDIKMSELLLDNGSDIHFKNQFGNTALHFAVINSTIEMIKLLMKYKANINEKNNYNETPLDFALFRQQIDFCYNLLVDETCGTDTSDMPITRSNMPINLNPQNQGKALEIIKFLKENGGISGQFPGPVINK